MGGDGVYKVELTFDKIKNGDKKSEKIDWDKPFPISSICRADLKENFTEEQIAKLDDGDMERIASKMGDAHMNTYWIDMEIIVRYILEDKDKEKK